MPVPRLESPRLRWREFTADDVPALAALHREPRVRALLVDDYPLDRAPVALAFVQRVQALYRRHEGLGLWACERALPPDEAALAEGRAAVDAGELAPQALTLLSARRWAFCGWFNLMPMPEAPNEVEIGCRLAPDAWGQGHALDGGEALLRHAFDTLSRPRVWGVCEPRHRSVHLCLLTLGFEPQGLRDYDGRPAAHFVIDSTGWRQVMAVPRRQRSREALARVKAGEALGVEVAEVEAEAGWP